MQPARLAAVVAPDLVELRRPDGAGSPASDRAAAATARPRGRRGCGAAGGAGCGARRCAGTVGRRAATGRRPARRSRRGSGRQRAQRRRWPDGSRRRARAPAASAARRTPRRAARPTPSFSWRSASWAGMCLEHPAAHRLDVLDEALARGRAPHHRSDRVGVLPAELEVTGHRTRLEQRLELPGLRPALVVATWLASVRTSGPALPSGRSAASTGQIVPSAVLSEQTCIIADASWVAIRRALSSQPGSSASPAGSATKITSTSLT